MKARFGFVSNSSSSSFIVAFPEWPLDKDALRKLMFGGQTEYENPFYDPSYNVERSWPIDFVVDQLWSQLERSSCLGVFEIANELCNGCVDEIELIVNKERDPNDKNFKSIIDKEKRRTEELAFAMARKFMDDNGDMYYLRFGFSDNDGPFFAALEHGNLFDGFPHIRISHH